MLNVAPQKERIPDHLRAMAEQDDKSAASGKTGEQSSIGVGCAPGEERDSAISICAVHSATVTAAIAEYCEQTLRQQDVPARSSEYFRRWALLMATGTLPDDDDGASVTSAQLAERRRANLEARVYQRRLWRTRRCLCRGGPWPP